MTEAHFQPQGFLRFDLGQGQLSTPDKRRHLVVPAEVLKAATTGDELDAAARRWGEEQGASLAGLVGADVLEQSPERFGTELAHFLATLGWGWCELESWDGVLFAVVHQAPRGGAVLRILRSFLAGALSAASGQPLGCVPVPEETQTRFLFTGPESVAEIQRWVDAGATAAQVVGRMMAGEHLSSPHSTTGGT
jgi:hypothetical protein